MHNLDKVKHVLAPKGPDGQAQVPAVRSTGFWDEHGKGGSRGHKGASAGGGGKPFSAGPGMGGGGKKGGSGFDGRPARDDARHGRDGRDDQRGHRSRSRGNSLF